MARLLRVSVAGHPHGPTAAAWLDDAEWAPWLTKLRSGVFSGAIMELPALSFGAAALRSADRPMGVKGLRGPDKEMVREETVIARRAATAAGILRSAESPWIGWGRGAPGAVASGAPVAPVLPWDTLSWTPLRPHL